MPGNTETEIFSEELKTLIKKRASIKSKLTLFEKFIENFTMAETVDRTKVLEMERRIQDAESLLITFDEIQNQVEINSEDFDSQFSEREIFENRFHSILAKAKVIFEKFNPISENNETQSESLSIRESNSVRFDGIKLPEIKLPKFDGSYETWMEFRDIFESLIHNNPQISGIQKFHYLRASLVSSAPQVIQSLEFSSENYDIAWNTLCERFNNNRLLIQNHIKAIFDMESINTESALKIRNLSDNLFKHLAALNQLEEPIDSWATLIIYIMSAKLDKNTAREWEKLKSKESSCTLESFKKFLKERANLLETLEMNIDHTRINKSDGYQNNNASGSRYGKRTGSKNFFINTESENNSWRENKTKYTCFFCKKDHSLFYCTDFLKLSIQDRMCKVKDLKLCVNCLRRNHFVKDCKWSGCKVCGAKHNTILHDKKERTNAAVLVNQDTDNSVSEIENSNLQPEVTSCTFATAQNAILSTAMVQIRDSKGNWVKARALLDCGSQSSFLTADLCETLNLPKIKADLTINGINDKICHSLYKCNLKIQSMNRSYAFNLSCFVLDKITSNIPDVKLNCEQFVIPSHIKLADPEFDTPSPIDLLIGADMFWSLLSVGRIDLGSNNPMLQSTRLGWIVAGPINTNINTSRCHFSQNITLQNQLAKFWEVEEVSVKNPLSIEETLCEKHFTENVTVTQEGRFQVSFPFKDSLSKLGESRETAIKQFMVLERRLISNNTLHSLYKDFLDEYERLGHMTEITDDVANLDPCYFMPHHGVLKESSSTTKLRVVFNASSPSSTGISLNQLQMTGPIIQDDLISIIIRFRMRSIVLSSDIKMMYRQVLIKPEHRKFQQILWRPSPNESLKTFQLNTVTYGTTAASFLAIRCLHEVAKECENEHPKIANIIKRDMYVDDLLTTVDTLEEANYVSQKISEVLLKRGFELRKWKSNNPDVIRNLNIDENQSTIEFSANKDNDNKILGLSWKSIQDTLTYKIITVRDFNQKKITKRVILSRIATIFDPLGLLAPCIIIAKTLLQKLWAENLTWDQSLPNHILNEWFSFSNELDILNTLNISRKVTCDHPFYIALHGFSDASERSYGACVYIVSGNSKNEWVCHLLCAKSKVSPLKSLTMPRLELCAALVLSQLMSKVISSTHFKFKDIYCWSDSTIVLGWLRITPNLLKPFVNNRVAEIQKLTESFEWRHVPTKENPADLVSRGLSPRALLCSDMWWHGPKWLIQHKNYWPKSQIISEDNLPERRNFSLPVIISNQVFPFERFSNLLTLKRTISFIFRFFQNCKGNREDRIYSPLTVFEINNSFEKLLKIAQNEMFPEECAIFHSKRTIPANSKILSLNPFMDNRGLLRVGGRLSNSDYPYSKKHPILLSSNHHLTKLIFEFEHERLLHAGPQQLLACIRCEFWPISGRSIARKVVRNCVKCVRYSAQTVHPIMGNLPASRVQPSLPFSKIGLDYAGPFLMKDRRGRGCKVIKVWVSLFVCFVTRAIHLELVLSLSTDDFLDAFKRFISRRGKPSDVYSDNGSQFVKANKEIQLMGKFLADKGTEISNSVANMGITWHFIPANSPHFGGVWEAGVKSLKYHLKRVLGSYTLFFYDFQSLLVQIEAVLNSRPLSPLSSNPNDLSALTPAHFLIGRSIVTIADPSVSSIAENRLSNFQLIQKIHEQFWNRWHHEYISEFQQRQKWKKNTSTLKTNQLVLVKDNSVPPMKWRLGRVVKLISGADGVNRVAMVKTADGLISRAIVRLCPLPVES